jgi:phosphoribosylformylglycinamidine cyclo-ligase
LLTPTRIYAKQILALAKEFPLKGIAHITGGGITENLPRVLPPQCAARIQRASWPVLPVCRLIQERGSVETEEMYRVFNMGIGLALVTSPAYAEPVLNRARELGDEGYIIGDIVAADETGARVRYVD